MKSGFKKHKNNKMEIDCFIYWNIGKEINIVKQLKKAKKRGLIKLLINHSNK